MTSNRLSPPFYDHQRVPLLALRKAIDARIAALGDGRGRTVIDIGSGDAPYRPLFEARGFRYIACDIGGSPDIEIVPGQPIPLEDGCADCVVSFQVLEHVWDLDWYLGECRRLLGPEAPLILSTHGTWLYHPHPTDFRRWTVDGLQAEINTRGLEVESIEGLVGPLAWTTQFRLLGYREVFLRIPILGELLTAAMASAMNARMLIEDAVTPATIRQNNASGYITVSKRSAVGAEK